MCSLDKPRGRDIHCTNWKSYWKKLFRTCGNCYGRMDSPSWHLLVHIHKCSHLKNEVKICHSYKHKNCLFQIQMGWPLCLLFLCICCRSLVCQNDFLKSGFKYWPSFCFSLEKPNQNYKSCRKSRYNFCKRTSDIIVDFHL